jgi:hypothetical protein
MLIFDFLAQKRPSASLKHEAQTQFHDGKHKLVEQQRA